MGHVDAWFQATKAVEFDKRVVIFVTDTNTEDGMTAAEFDAFGATARTLRVFCEHYYELLGIVRDAMVPNPDKKK